MSQRSLPSKKDYYRKRLQNIRASMDTADIEEQRLRARERQKKSRESSKRKLSLNIGHDNFQQTQINHSDSQVVENTSDIVHRRKGKEHLICSSDEYDITVLNRKAKRHKKLLEYHESRVHNIIVFPNSLYCIGETSNTKELLPDEDFMCEIDYVPIQHIPVNNTLRIDNNVISPDGVQDHDRTTTTVGPAPQSSRRWQNILLDIGPKNIECPRCHALMFMGERITKSSKNSPKFGMCCRDGLIKLPQLPHAPLLLEELINGVHDTKDSKFIELIRNYNSMFSFTSMGGKIDHTVLGGRGPYTFKISGANYHRIGTLLPSESGPPKFGQLYIHDPIHEINNRIGVIHQNIRPKIKRDIVERLQKMLDGINPYVMIYRQARHILNTEIDSGIDLRIRILNNRSTDGRQYILPTSNEVAALMIGDGNEQVEKRDVIICRMDGALKRISESHPAYMPLQYPLLFPFGEEGWRIGIPYANGIVRGRQKRVSIREYYSFRLQDRALEKSILLRSGRLFQQYIVDSYAAIEQERLNWIRLNQKTIRSELFQGLQDAVTVGETDASAVGHRFVLPSSFHGGPRDMYQNYQDAIAICRWAGPPDFFITFTCNPKWNEITAALSNQRSEDRPDIISRVFNLKLKELLKDIKVKKLFGNIIADIYVIEFQKRGLPHAHILLTVAENDKPRTVDQIDKFVSAEIPDKFTYPKAHEIVLKSMIHGPCSKGNARSSCFVNDVCTKHYPKAFSNETVIDKHGYVQYRRRDDGKFFLINGMTVDNRWVVPYNKDLLTRYEAHINVEICAHPKLIKYLYKYIHKGHDRSTIVIEDNCAAGDNGAFVGVRQVDEIKQYLDCRYVSSSESCWRIFEFSLHNQHPSIERLQFHLPNQHNVTFNDSDFLEDIITRDADNITQLLGWFHANQKYADANDITYIEFPQKWVWHSNIKQWKRRKSQFSIGRLYFAHPTSGERFYLRMLLCVVCGAKNYEDIRTVRGVVHSTFKSACIALGLLEDDSEWNNALLEASTWTSGRQMRMLFCSILMFCEPTNPRNLWDIHWKSLSDDFLQIQIRQSSHILGQLSDDMIQNMSLNDIENILNLNGRSLKDYLNMPFPTLSTTSDSHNRLIREETNYDIAEELLQYKLLEQQLNEDQRKILHSIVDSNLNNEGGVHFIYGSGGTGKTFLYKVLIAKYRAESKIVLSVASSGIAALLLPGGRTAHSRFKIPLLLHESSNCSINQQSQLSELIQRAELIIWDEAPMTNRNAFEAVDRTFRDLMKFKNPRSNNEIFGGKKIVFGGDFRQILPVIPKAGRESIISSSLHRSYIWHHCVVHQLIQNMRLQHTFESSEGCKMREFAEWILQVGDGKILGLHAEDLARDFIKIPDDLLIRGMTALVDKIYTNIDEPNHDHTYFEQRAILAPKNEDVDKINAYILSLFPGEVFRYLSADSLADPVTDHRQMNAHPPEFLNSIRSSGLANHCLELKKGVPILLLRNLNSTLGLCNGTRLIVHRLGARVIEAKIITGTHVGEITIIPRIIMSPTIEEMPIPIRRRQFPIKLAFAMTINKSQGQTLQRVGLYLKNPVFCHGQFYVAVSRCSNRSGLKIMLTEDLNDNVNHTYNVVYKDVIYDICNSIS